MGRKVSIIIPMYNCAEYIHACVESVLKNTYRNIEVILVDDGSTDSTLDECLKYQTQSKIKLISQTNRGPSHARNTGINNASGDYIVFVDADDIVSETYVEHLVDLMEESGAVMAQNSHIVFHSLEALKATSPKSLEKQSCTVVEAFSGLWCNGIMDGYLWNKIFLTEIIRDSCLSFREDIRIWEDSLFVFEYLKKCNGICIVGNSTDYYYRVNQASITHKPILAKDLTEKLKVLARISNLNVEPQSIELNKEIEAATVRVFLLRVKLRERVFRTELLAYWDLIKNQHWDIIMGIKVYALMLILVLRSIGA